MTERVKKLVTGNAALTRLADWHLLGLISPTISQAQRFISPVTNHAWSRAKSVAHPATLPHPDRRALLILFAAQHVPPVLRPVQPVYMYSET